MNTLTLLHIEDDQIEILKFKRILNKLEQKHQIIGAKNGEEALDTLHTAALLPDLILLDLNMPKMNGLEFLNLLKNDERLKYIPVVILTTSSNQKDIKECYKIGIAGYMVKPLRYEDYKKQLIIILDYWSSNKLTTL